MSTACSVLDSVGFTKGRTALFAAATLLLLSGCAQYAMKKDLNDLQEKSGQKNQELTERISKVEQAPKADPAVLSALAERVDKIEKHAKELESKKEPQSQMSLDIKKVEVEYKDIDVLTKKIDDLDKRLKTINATKKVELKVVHFPLGKTGVKDLPRTEQAKLLDNAARIKEERPSKVEIATWSDSRGTAEKREKVAAERAKNIASFYRKKVGGGESIEFYSVSKVATISGSFWRRADTTMWMTEQ